jgi:hypothetical protein
LNAKEDTNGKKVNVKGKRDIPVLVRWSRDIEDIVRKHANTRVPKEDGDQSRGRNKKFIQSDFEALFKRGFPWIEKAVQAADDLRYLQSSLAEDDAQEFEDYLDTTGNPIGMETFGRELERRVEACKKERGEV